MKFKVPSEIAPLMVRTRKDFVVQTFRAGGKGGQNQNKRDTGVRIIDKITGLSAEARDQRSQDQNKKAAFVRLVNRMVQHYRFEAKKIPIVATPGFGGTYVRTYSEPRNLARDHRTKKDYGLSQTLDGDLAPIHQDLLKILPEIH